MMIQPVFCIRMMIQTYVSYEIILFTKYMDNMDFGTLLSDPDQNFFQKRQKKHIRI